MRLEQGLVQVYTGDGKGKTTAALGLALRASGHGLKVCIIQYMKGGDNEGALATLNRLNNVTIKRFGRAGFVNLRRPDPADVRCAREAWQESLDRLRSGECDLVILDEVNVAARHRLISLEQLWMLLDARPQHVELVMTGRDAPPELLERADLVTEMRSVKHPYARGVKAREGIEY